MEGNSVPRREEIPEQYTWDLSGLYPDAAAWERELETLEEKIAAAEAFRGRLGDSPATLRDFLGCEEDLSRTLERLYCYAHLRADENTADAASQKILSRIRRRYADAAARTAWIEPELAALPPEKFAGFRNAPELAANHEQFMLRNPSGIPIRRAKHAASLIGPDFSGKRLANGLKYENHNHS